DSRPDLDQNEQPRRSALERRMAVELPSRRREEAVHDRLRRLPYLAAACRLDLQRESVPGHSEADGHLLGRERSRKSAAATPRPAHSRADRESPRRGNAGPCSIQPEQGFDSFLPVEDLPAPART